MQFQWVVETSPLCMPELVRNLMKRALMSKHLSFVQPVLTVTLRGHA